MRILSLSVLISLYYLTFKGLRIDEICHAFLIPDNFLSVFDIDAFGLYVVWQRYTLEGVTAFDGRFSLDFYTLNTCSAICWNAGGTAFSHLQVSSVGRQEIHVGRGDECQFAVVFA